MELGSGVAPAREGRFRTIVLTRRREDAQRTARAFDHAEPAQPLEVLVQRSLRLRRPAEPREDLSVGRCITEFRNQIVERGKYREFGTGETRQSSLLAPFFPLALRMLVHRSERRTSRSPGL